MNVAVVGTGYVGLVTGAVFADLGNDVVCVDKDAAKIEALRAGRMPIYEPGLEELVTRNFADGRLTFSTDLADAVRRSDIVFIAVGTPPKATGESDLTAVEEVAHGIAAGPRSLQGHRQQVHGAGGHRRPGADHHRAQPAPAGQLRRRLEPRVPPRGLGHRGHAPPRPDRRRRAQPAGGDDAARALRAPRAADDHHGRLLRRDHQVRVERVPGRRRSPSSTRSPTSASSRGATSPRS